MVEIVKERGFFWWFNEPNLPANSEGTSVPALLTITDDGQITLDADGALCLNDEYQDWFKPRTFPESRRIAGRLASSGKYVLLEGLERTDISFPDESPQQQQFGAQLCVRRDSLGLSPGVRQTVKTLFAVRWNCIVLRRRLLAKCAPAGEAEAGSAGVQPAKE